MCLRLCVLVCGQGRMFLCTGASGTGPAVGLPAFLWHDHICAVHVRALTVEVSVRTSMCLEMCAGVCVEVSAHTCVQSFAQ